MIKLDNMLMIGSAGSNVGKTELACALLRKFSKKVDIIGIKVTTIKDKDGQCPRGGKGCGVCSSLDGDFYITEETNSNSDKDTAKLLTAGAFRVFWLRAMKIHLKEAITTLLEIINSDSVSICESNSLRQIVQPGLFLMVSDPSLKVWKTSAQKVKQYADRIIISNNSSFDSLHEEIKLTNGKWTLLERATAIVMAGGGSQRMGTDKSLLLINNRPIIENICEQLRGRFNQILISANSFEKYKFLGFEIIPDKEPNQGPLMGIASALEASANELNFVTACDIPKIDLGCIGQLLREADLSKADIVLPTTSQGKYEALFAVYRKSSLEAINKVLHLGGRKISDVFELCKVKTIEMSDKDWLVNLNTIAEYEEFKKKNSSKF